jgi:hypothetical protein
MNKIYPILYMSETNESKRLVLWTTDHEDILIEWADKAMCYRWLHSNSNTLYTSKNTWYTIPVIIISTVTGTANFAQERVPLEYQTYFVMLVGALNIVAGIITTIQQFLKITQLNEAHRVATIAWDKFYRNIKIELAKHPDERINVLQMLKMSKEEFDRLIETSPNIPELIITKFKTQFASSESFKEIKKPEICDELISTQNIRNQWNSEDHISKKQMMILEKENEMKNMVTQFKNNFFKMNGRQPLEFEIMDNLKEKIDSVQLEVLKQICNSEAMHV